MENATKKAPACEGERRERTITVRVVEGTSESKAAYEAYKRTHALIKHLKKQENGQTGRNYKTE